MDLAQFWSIIGESYRPDSVEQAEALREALGPLMWFEVLDFQALFEKFVAAADTPELRAAAFLINGDAADSGFRNFRLGLVASVKRAYEAALVEADSLADFLDGDPLDGFGLDKMAIRAYEEKTGGSDFFAKLAEKHPQAVVTPVKTHWRPPNAIELRSRFPNLSTLYPSDDEPTA